jgi:SPASM domain peptide maturase of grasp-with-spasm system
MKNNNNYFKLFSNCIPVRGIKNSLIYDLQRSNVHKVSNNFLDSLPLIESLKLSEIVSKNEALASFLHNLAEEEIGFFCEEPDRFPKISTEWDSPNIISNAVLEISIQSNHDYNLLFESLDKLFCRNMLLMFYDAPSEKELLEILEIAFANNIFYVEIWSLTDFNTNRIIKKYNIVRKIVILNSKKEYEVEKRSVIKKYKKETTFENLCKKTPQNYFLNLDFYNESLAYNTCLNKKLTIDRFHKIKNCPFLPEDYGDYRNVKIEEIVQTDEFMKLWFVTKDKIQVCKDCEYRYMCKDCRAFTVDNKIDGKPVFCNYNPY